jgi:hypothetical protein
MTTRLTHVSTDFALRAYLYGNVSHFYRKRDLADPELEWLIPWCEEDDSYPDRHARAELKLSAAIPTKPWCPRCTYRGLF